MLWIAQSTEREKHWSCNSIEQNIAFERCGWSYTKDRSITLQSLLTGNLEDLF